MTISTIKPILPAYHSRPERNAAMRDVFNWAKRTGTNDLSEILSRIERNLPNNVRALRFCAHLAINRRDIQLSNLYLEKLRSLLTYPHQSHLLANVNDAVYILGRMTPDFGSAKALLSERTFEQKRTLSTAANEFFARKLFFKDDLCLAVTNAFSFDESLPRPDTTLPLHTLIYGVNQLLIKDGDGESALEYLNALSHTAARTAVAGSKARLTLERANAAAICIRQGDIKSARKAWRARNIPKIEAIVSKSHANFLNQLEPKETAQ